MEESSSIELLLLALLLIIILTYDARVDERVALQEHQEQEFVIVEVVEKEEQIIVEIEEEIEIKQKGSIYKEIIDSFINKESTEQRE